jgi:hypothetical protein
VVTDVEGDAVVLPVAAGAAEGVVTDWQALSDAIRLVRQAHNSAVRVALIGPRQNAGSRAGSRLRPTGIRRR